MIIREKKDSDYQKKILLVNLEENIFKTNTYYEFFWDILSSNFLNVFKIIKLYLADTNLFKDFLFKNNTCDISKFPINQEAISFLKKWKENEDKIILYSGLKNEVVHKIKKDLKIFDASEPFAKIEKDFLNNIKSSYPEYSLNILVSSEKKNNEIHEDLKNISFKRKKLKISHYLKQFRPKHWIKNLLVFSPMLLLYEFNLDIFFKCLKGFFFLSFFASTVYVINDLLDLNSDRNNKYKKNRPLASGEVSIKFFSKIIPFQIILGILISYSLFPEIFVTVLSYFILSLFYAFYLKKKLMIDIFTLAFLFTLRIIVGVQASNVEISIWILAFSIFLFIALASVKRFSEIKDSLISRKKFNASRAYEAQDLEIIQSISLISSFASSIIFALYINTTEVKNLILNIESLWLICMIILYWLLRLNLLARKPNFQGDPLEFSLNDKVSYLCFFIIVILFANGNYNFISFAI